MQGLDGAGIVHDDNVGGFEDRHELLLDPGAQAPAIDRPVEHARRREPVAPTTRLAKIISIDH